jgi:hypothetical protein
VVESFSGMAQDMPFRGIQTIAQGNQFALFAVYKGLPEDRTD